MLAQRLEVRVEHAGVLAQPSALLPGLACSYHPQGIHLPQLSALLQPEQTAVAAQRHTDPSFWCGRWSSSEALASAPLWCGGVSVCGAARSGSAQACACGSATGQSSAAYYTSTRIVSSI